MTINELTKEDRKLFEDYFTSNDEVRQLEQKFSYYKKHNMFIQALETGQKIDILKNTMFKVWMAKIAEQAEAVDLNRLNLSDEVKEYMNVLYVTVFMACDIIESCVLDMNSTLKKVDKKLSVELFDDLIRLSKNAQDKIAFFQRNSGYLNNSFWGYKCDDMYKMMQNKAKKLIQHNKDL